jgi:4-hydroxy-2-oxoglutarate aldolase
MKALAGIFAPVVSTFSKTSGDVDAAAFASNIQAHLASGLDGIVVTGSTGEAVLLDVEERGIFVDAARSVIPEDKLLIVGTGAESTRMCLRFTRDAAHRGADAVLVVAPHYYASAMTIDALRAHYRRVADESPVPVILYNIPKYMHFALPAELVAELAQHENVIGIKDSSGKADLFAGFMRAQSETFSVLTGNGPFWQQALAAGARGGILAVSLFAPAISRDIYDAMQRGDTETAVALQERLTPPGGRIVGDLGVPGVKAAMDAVGLSGGPVRSPLLPLGAAQVAEVRELLRSAELATA